MASSHHTTLPRRAVIAGAAAALAVAPVMAAVPSAGDPVFAAKKQRVVDTWAKLNALYEEIERQTSAMKPMPVLPKELLQPMHLPGKSTPTTAHEEGWSAYTLSEIVRSGLYLTAPTVHTATGGTMRTEWKPVSAKTRKQAAELLKVRQAYDAERAAWLERMHTIEGASSAPLNEAIDLALDLMAYPVFTLAEVKDKLAMVEEFDLFNLTDEGDNSLRNALLRDALAVAEKAVSHA